MQNIWINYKNKIVKFQEQHKFINATQHGLSNISCLINFIKFYHKVLTHYYNTNILHVIYLDFKKSFDSIPQDKYMYKLGLWELSLFILLETGLQTGSKK